jgi:hypothetical protein
MLLMFLHLIEAGRISWARGLGPQATDRSSLSAQERATYFGKGRAEIDNDVKQIDNATAGVKVTDKPEEQWLKKFVALHDLQGEVKRMVLSEGNVKSISGLGGALPMVGAQTAASGDMSKDSPAIALVDKKEVTVVVEWFSWKLGQIQTQMEQGSQNSRKVWIALGGPKQQQIIEWLLRLQLLGQLDQTVLTQAQQDAQQLL